MLITSSIPNLVNGISQQPPAIRLSSQGSDQVNGLSSVSEGLRKRPPSSYVSKIGTTSVSNAFLHIINRDLDERYIVTIRGGALTVHDLLGSEKVVNFPAGTAYLTAVANPANVFRAVTIADSTFLINTERTVTKSPLVYPVRGIEGMVDVRIGNYGKTYKIKLNGTVYATHTTPLGDVSSHVAQIDTSYIAQQLVVGLNASLGASGWTFVLYGATIHITGPTAFNIAVEDGFNGNAMKATKDEVQRFSDLPVNAPAGITLAVLGTDGNEADNYYVRYDNVDTGGIWKEATKPGSSYRLNSQTMPHTLIREANGSFTFSEVAWSDRLVGDDESSPFPSFTDRTLTDMFFYRNRLGFLSDENVIFSAAGEFFKFFPSTVTTVLDSDPIDVAVSHTKVSLLRFAIPFAENLILFSGQTQFKVNSGEILTPRTISIDQTTEFECSTTVKPVGVGRSVYFDVPRGDYSAVKEYYVDPNSSDVLDASDVTAHIPNYLPGDIFKLAAATNEDIVVALSTTMRNRVYVYKFYWAKEQKLQSSWSYWELADTDTILNAEFIQADLYLLISRADGLFVEKIRVSPGALDPDADFVINLDRKHKLQGTELVYNAATGFTTFTTPFNYGGTGWTAVVSNWNTGLSGKALAVTRVSSTTARVSGDYSGITMIVGIKYNFKYTFSTVMIRKADGSGGQSSMEHGRLQITRMGIGYSKTGYFKTTVTVLGSDEPFVSSFSGVVLGSSAALLGIPALATGVFYFPVKTRNTNATISVESDSPYPCTLLNAQWEGKYNFRAKQV